MKDFNAYIDDFLASDDKIKKQLKFLKKSDLKILILILDRKHPFAVMSKKLLYIIDGVIPLLSGLCQELSCHLYARTIPDMTPESVEVIRMLGDKLKVYICLSQCI